MHALTALILSAGIIGAGLAISAGSRYQVIQLGPQGASAAMTDRWTGDTFILRYAAGNLTDPYWQPVRGR